MAVEVREAKPEDVPFLAWVVLAASRSHLERGVWDLFVEGTEADRLRFLETLLTSERPHWCHHRGFLVAEGDGRPAAALSGYPADGSELATPGDAILEAVRSLGWSDARRAASFERLGVFLRCLPGDAPDAWIVEWVATRPEFRRRGLVDRLLAAELDRGRRRGHRTAQILVLIDNTPAQRAYEKAGFRAVDEKRHPDFEAALGSPGLRRLLRPL